jgi:acyl-ACP thioesterase
MMLFEKCYELRAADFDCHDRIHPASILSLFQDVAGIHANELGIGFDALMASKTIWVLTKVCYRMVGTPRRYERVRVRTWPLRPGRVNFRREYCIETEGGEVLVQGTSEWVVVHSEKRRVLPATELYPSDDYCTDTVFPARLPRVPRMEREGDGVTVVPGFTQLDINGHINNTCYADYVMDALAPDATMAVRGLQIDYHRELLAGTAVQLWLQRQDDTVLSCAYDAGGECMFTCRLTVEEV